MNQGPGQFLVREVVWSLVRHHANPAESSPTTKGLPWPLHRDAQSGVSNQPLSIEKKSAGGKCAQA